LSQTNLLIEFQMQATQDEEFVPPPNKKFNHHHSSARFKFNFKARQEKNNIPFLSVDKTRLLWFS